MTTKKFKKKFTNKLKNKINKFTKKLYNKLRKKFKNKKKNEKSKKLRKAKGTKEDIEHLLAKKLENTHKKTTGRNYDGTDLAKTIISNLSENAIKNVVIKIKRKKLIEKYKEALKQNELKIEELEKKIIEKEQKLKEKQKLKKKSPPRTRARQKTVIVDPNITNLDNEIEQLERSISVDNYKLKLLKNPIDLKVEIEMFNMRYQDLKIDTNEIE
jgi:hypothetical protein